MQLSIFDKIGEGSEVDEREEARYSSSTKIEKVNKRYEEMMLLCKKAIEQTEEIVYSDAPLEFPQEIHHHNP